MKIEILGSGGYFANERRHTSCLLLPELGLIFDAGTATFRLASRAMTSDVDLFLSHSHLDHIFGLSWLLIPILSGQFQQIRLYGTKQTLDAVRTHLLSQTIFPAEIPMTYHEIESPGDLTTACGAIVRWQELPSHPGKSMAYRVDHDGRSFAYVTDTSVDGSYTEFIRGVDLLVHECYFPDSQAELADLTGHSYASVVAQLAHDAEVKRLIVTHVDPNHPTDDPIGLPGMRQIFPDCDIAVDGMVAEI